MDDPTLLELGQRLAEEVARGLPVVDGKRARCPGELRTKLVSFAHVCRERGEPVRDIAERLGLTESTLTRWLRADRKELAAGFRSVAIVPSEEAAPEGRDEQLRLLTPRGYCVEGLDPQTLAFLLRVVG